MAPAQSAVWCGATYLLKGDPKIDVHKFRGFCVDQNVLRMTVTQAYNEANNRTCRHASSVRKPSLEPLRGMMEKLCEKPTTKRAEW